MDTPSPRPLPAAAGAIPAAPADCAGTAAPLPPLIEPTRLWAVRTINQDSFWFFHLHTRPGDYLRLFQYGNTFSPPVFTCVAWQQDHLCVTANPLYVGEGYEPADRFARPLVVLLGYYELLSRLGRQFGPPDETEEVPK